MKTLPQTIRTFLLAGLVTTTAGQAMAISLQDPVQLSSSRNEIMKRTMESFHGKDLAGKNGPMVKVGPDLTLTFHEHLDYKSRGGEAKLKYKFKPSHPLIRTKDEAVIIDIVAQDNVNALKAELQALGMTNISVYGRFISGLLPIDALETVAGLNRLRFARPAYAKSMTGSVTSQGDAAQTSDDARSNFGVDGASVMVGTLSDSYNCNGGAAADVASDDLPTGVVVLAEESGCGSGTDEGRAMMQIIHDVAPGATQVFHTAFDGEASFAQGIIELATAGADVINDDVIYFAEPMFQDGIIAQAIDTVKASGVAYFSAAGNQADQSYEGNFSSSGVRGYRTGSVRHDFNPGGGTDSLMLVSIPKQTQVIFVLQWDDPFFSVSGAPGALTDLDMIVYSSEGVALFGGIANNIGGDAVELFAVTNSTGSTKNYQIAIDHVSGPAPGKIKFVYFGNMTIAEYDTNSSSSYGHPIAAGGQAVGAARYTQTPEFGTSPPVLEYFSSRGGTPILFDTTGNPVNIVRQKPDIVAPDGGNNTFFGNDSSSDADSWPNFFGTSAAAPHAAGVAALLLDNDPSLSPDDVYSTLQTTAINMGVSGFDFDSGHGLIQANLAVGSLDPDGDGLSNTTEINLDTNPNSADTDGDGLADGAGGIILLVDFPGGVDTNGDGYVDGEQDFDTDPTLGDTDSDGISDGDEVSTYDIDPLKSNLGDVAPLNAPDDQLNAADILIMTRLVTGELSPGDLQDTLGDMNGINGIDLADLLLLQQQVLAP